MADQTPQDPQTPETVPPTLYDQSLAESPVVQNVVQQAEADVPAKADFTPAPQVADLQAEIDRIEQLAKSDEVHDAYAGVSQVVAETKKGYKTTEFWVAVASLVAVNLNGVVMSLPDKYQAIASAAIAGLYAVSRGFAKQGVPDVKPQVPPEA
jgi:hypothetical protein